MAKKASSRTVRKGDRIQIFYRGMMEDGSEFESNFDKEPFEMKIGETKTIKGFEKSLIGMKEDEVVKNTFSPEEAFGHYNPALIATMKKSEFPKNSIPAVGWMMKIGNITVTVQSMDDSTVTLDGNHPLAGKQTIFEIKVVKIF